MPMVDGYAFLEKFSELRKKEGIDSKVVMMSTSSNTSEHRRRIAPFQFVTCHLVKGETEDQELKAIIEKLLQ